MGGQRSRRGRESNPFAAGRVQPGAVGYDCSLLGTSPEELLGRLDRLGGRGHIVGRHGVGKTTLLWTLANAAESDGRAVLRLDRHDPMATLREHRPDGRTLCVLDSAEALGWWTWRAVLGRVQRSGSGLLTTAHGLRGLPELIRLRPGPEVLEKLVGGLLAGREHPAGLKWPSAEQIRRIWEEQGGDIRESLFALYDWWEQDEPLPDG